MECTVWIESVLNACLQYIENRKPEYEDQIKKLGEQFSEMTESTKTEILMWFENNLDWQGISTIYSVLIQFTASTEFSDALFEYLQNRELSYEEGVDYCVNMSVYSKGTYLQLRNLYHKVCGICEETLNINPEYIPVEKRNKNRVVIVTEQILGVRHSPTRVVLQQAYTFQKRLGYEVFIVTVPSTHVLQNWINPAIFNYDLNADNHFWKKEFKGEVFLGFQLLYGDRGIEPYKAMYYRLKEWNPLFVLYMGVFNPYSEIFHTFTTCVAQKMSEGLAVSEADILIAGEDVKKTEDYRIYERYYKTKQTLLTMEHVPQYYEMSTSDLSRADRGYKEESFLIAVVGNRLGKDIDETFIEVLKSLLEYDDSIEIVMIGEGGAVKPRLTDKVFENRVYYQGYCKDLMAEYKVLDLYLNPFRQGGGFSAYMALSAGVPVLSLNQGDVSGNVGKDFCVETKEDMISWVKDYLTDNAFKEQILMKVQNFRSQNSEEVFWNGMERNTRKIIECVMKHDLKS